MLNVNEYPPLVRLNDALFTSRKIELFLYQLYLNHPTIMGNKWYKLKYNLQQAKQMGHKTILTFGGAWSSHIYATAAACEASGFSCIGIIRGERTVELNSTLDFAIRRGMRIHYLDRAGYKNKKSRDLIKTLHEQFGEFYLIPEGGSNALGVKGCTEITTHIQPDHHFDYVCCPCGTGATLAGIALSLKKNQKALGFSALKGGTFLKEEVRCFMEGYPAEKELMMENFDIQTDYHFGGYAKTTPELLNFSAQFEKQHGIPLDKVYTAKMMFGIYDLIRKSYFKPGDTIVAIHTGGLQTNAQFNGCKIRL